MLHLQNNDLRCSLPTHIPSSPLPFSETYPPAIRWGDPAEIPHNTAITQHNRSSGWMHYTHTADNSFFFFLGVTIQQAHTPPPRASEHKVGYLAVKQEQLSYVLVMPLLKYCKVPAELSETAWIKGILSQRHCNINTLCLVTYSLPFVFEVDVHWRGFLAV